MRLFSFFKIFILLALIFSKSIYGQDQIKNNAVNDGEIYLKCNSKGDIDGINDIHIDLNAKTFTDYFGTSLKYREEGQFFIAENIKEVESKKFISSITRINKFTLEFTWTSPPLNLYKAGKCSRVAKQF